MSLSSKDQDFAAMSSQTNTNDEEYPRILNWLSDESSLVPDLTITSKFLVTWSKESMLRGANTISSKF